jgi:signal transduction histidine kinase/CheY-like chemotaxis protein
MPMILAVNIVNAALVAVVLASYLNQSRWWIFFGLVATLTGVRASAWQCYRRAQGSRKSEIAWAIFATAGSGLSGLLWGLSSTLLLSDNIVEQTFFAFVVGGMCAGALVSLSYYLPAFIAYVYASALPLASSFLLDGRTVYVAMGCMALVFTAAVTFAAYHFNRAFVNGLRLNLDLADRTAELIRQTAELTTTNSRLQSEIAQREFAEKQLHQSQKLEALGQLTGGIAHDFNNLLTAVIGNLELAHKRTEGDPHTSKLLDTALGAAERGATLIRDLLTFARRQNLQPSAVDISAVVDAALKILKQTIGPNIRLIIRSEPGLRPAWVDPNQLELAIINLALNARDAMPGGGTLQMGCETRRADAENGPAELVPGDYLVLSLSDSGTGMSEATLGRVFEPFFTTKEVGRGSGLGLPMVQGFAAQSKGAVRISSRLGEGTTVELWLPRAEDDRSTESVPVRPRGSSSEQRQPGRILVCDDDGDVRSLIGDILREVGHLVWEANNPNIALQMLKDETIDVLVVDYAMPDMNGFAVIETARTCCPGIKAILVSGHPEALLRNESSEISVLPKPFKPAELSKRVAELLN